MVVNAVRIRPTGQETEWVDVGYALLIALEPKVGESAKSVRPSIGEILVAADLEGLTVIYERNEKSYELRINLLGESPQFVQEVTTPIKKMW